MVGSDRAACPCSQRHLSMSACSECRSPAPWTLFAQALLARSSAQTTLSLDRSAPVSSNMSASHHLAERPLLPSDTGQEGSQLSVERYLIYQRSCSAQECS